MKKFFFAAAILLASGLVPAVASAAESPTVMISEVAWAGSSKGTADEWLELTNVSESAVDLSGFTLEGAGTSGTALTIPAGTVLEPHQTFLISNFAAADAKSVLASSQFVTTAVSLSNSTLGITLKDAAGTVLDRAGDGKTPKAGSSVAPFASMIRLDPSNDGSLAASWATASVSTGFDDGIADLGTPGILDFTFAPPPEPAPTEIPAPVTEETAAPVVVEPAPIIEEPAPVATEPVVETVIAPEPIVEPAPEIVQEPIATITVEEPVVPVESTVEPAAEPVVEPVPETIEAAPAIETASETVAVVTPPGTLVVN